MVGKWEPFEVPCGIEAAAWRFAAAVKADGFESGIVHVADKQVNSLSLFEEDDTQHFIKEIKGEWFEHVSLIDDADEIDGGEDHEHIRAGAQQEPGDVGE